MTKHSDSSKHLQLVPHKNSSHLFDIKLQLEFQTRFIGKLDITDNGTLILNRRKEHILNKINAFGINYELLSDERIKFKWIKIFCEKDVYISTREYFFDKGKIFHFGKKGFELQVFVGISELNIDTIRKYERDKNNQFRLFS